MDKRTYLDKPIFDIPRIPENEELFRSILDEDSGGDIEKRDGRLLFDSQEKDIKNNRPF